MSHPCVVILGIRTGLEYNWLTIIGFHPAVVIFLIDLFVVNEPAVPYRSTQLLAGLYKKYIVVWKIKWPSTNN